MKVFIQKHHLHPEHFIKLKEEFSMIEWEHDVENRFDADVWIVYPNLVTEEHIQKADHLSWVQLLQAGYNKVDLEMLMKHKVMMTNTKGVFSKTIAEDVFAKILYFKRNILIYAEAMKNKEWIRYDAETEITESVVGILGAGSIATAIAKRMKAFETTVYGYRRTNQPQEYFDEIFVGIDGLKELLSKSDIVVVTLPLNNDTSGLLTKELLLTMKEDAILVNIGRGEVINEEDLIEVLQARPKFRAGLDVTEKEPLIASSPLWEMKNVFITPHNSASSPRIFERKYQLIRDNLRRYVQKEELLNKISEMEG